MNPAPSQNQSPQSNQNHAKVQNVPKKNRPFRIGIIVNEGNAEDIIDYNEQLRFINKYGSQVVLVIFGYKPEDDKHNMFEGISFEYIRPVSIIHFPKQLKSTEIDLLFIPLMDNKYNHTSENSNKYLELGQLQVPVLAPYVFPYNELIEDKKNGFLFGTKADFIPYLTNLLANEIDTIKPAGIQAHKDVTTNYNFSPANVKLVETAFETKRPA